jgi:hypothetical protein
MAPPRASRELVVQLPLANPPGLVNDTVQTPSSRTTLVTAHWPCAVWREPTSLPSSITSRSRMSICPWGVDSPEPVAGQFRGIAVDALSGRVKEDRFTGDWASPMAKVTFELARSKKKG